MIENVDYSMRCQIIGTINGINKVEINSDALNSLAERMEFEGMNALYVEIKDTEIVFIIKEEVNLETLKFICTVGT